MTSPFLKTQSTLFYVHYIKSIRFLQVFSQIFPIFFQAEKEKNFVEIFSIIVYDIDNLEFITSVLLLTIKEVAYAPSNEPLGFFRR